MQKLLLIDGNSLFHRAYHALPPLTDKRGEMANAVFGFSNMLLKAINEIKPDYIACAFDTAAPTFRHIEFEKYKAQRPAPPPDLYPQLPKVKKILEAFGIPYFEKDGYEADDIIATLATQVVNSTVIASGTKQSKKKIATSSRDSSTHSIYSGQASSGLGTPRNDNMDVVILSGDRDVLQLVDGNIKVQMPGWNMKETTLYGAREVKEKYGLETEQMVDYKSLIGDPSDNIPGIAGIGPKTAASLLQKYHTLEKLFDHLDELPETVRSKLEAGEDVALAAKKLVELDRNVDLTHSTSSGSSRFRLLDLRFKPDWEKVRAEYEELGFKSILAKLPESKSSQVSNVSKVNSKGNNDQLKLV